MTNKPQARDELLPCPFCGEAPKLTVRGNAAGYQCRGKTHLIWAYGTNRFEALVNWNTRAAHSLMAAKVAELEACLMLVRRIAVPLLQVDDVWEDATLIVTAIDRALAPHPEAQQQEDQV